MADLDAIQTLIAASRKDEAARQLARVLSTNPDDIQAWLLMASVIDDPARKADCYRQALKLDPQNPVALEFFQKSCAITIPCTPAHPGAPLPRFKKNQVTLPPPSRWQARRPRWKKEPREITLPQAPKPARLERNRFLHTCGRSRLRLPSHPALHLRVAACWITSTATKPLPRPHHRQSRPAPTGMKLPLPRRPGIKNRQYGSSSPC